MTKSDYIKIVYDKYQYPCCWLTEICEAISANAFDHNMRQVISQITSGPCRYPGWKFGIKERKTILKLNTITFHPIRVEVEMSVRPLFFTFFAA